MSKQPLVSICIPSYNHEKYIEKTISSIISQDYCNIELIIIDDCSVDNTNEVIKTFTKQCNSRFVRFEYFKNDKNQGISRNLNTAIKWAKGKYFYAVASDDVLMTSKTSLLVREIEKLDSSYAAIFGDALFIDEEGKEILVDKDRKAISGKNNNDLPCYKSVLDYYTHMREFNYKDESFEITYATLLKGNYLPAQSNLIRLDKLVEIKGCTAGNMAEDIEMWLKLSQYNKIALIKEPVAYYRIHSNNVSSTTRSNLVKDEITLLQEQKNFAFNQGYGDIFMERMKFLISVIMAYDESFARFFADLNNLKFKIKRVGNDYFFAWKND